LLSVAVQRPAAGGCQDCADDSAALDTFHRDMILDQRRCLRQRRFVRWAVQGLPFLHPPQLAQEVEPMHARLLFIHCTPPCMLSGAALPTFVEVRISKLHVSEDRLREFPQFPAMPPQVIFDFGHAGLRPTVVKFRGNAFTRQWRDGGQQAHRRNPRIVRWRQGIPLAAHRAIASIMHSTGFPVGQPKHARHKDEPAGGKDFPPASRQGR
jgi:hypothetical protein